MGSPGYYPYDPSTAGAVVAMLLFGASSCVHLWQMIKTRTWFFTAFLIGAFSEPLPPLSLPGKFAELSSTLEIQNY